MGRNWQRVCVHLVWATWDRLPLLTDDIERDVYRYIEKVCADDKCDVLAIGGMPDHVHLLVMLPGTIGYATLLQHVKGGSSRLISKKLKPGQWFAWQGHYGAVGVSAERDITIRYIANQKQHHANGSIWPSLEKTEEDDDTS